MIVEQDLERLFDQLVYNAIAEIDVGGSTVTVQVLDHASKLALSTPVYHGGNYIPPSVRTCISEKAPFDQGRIPTKIDLDEDNFQVILNYSGFSGKLKNQIFIDLLQEFCWLAEEWRYYLDEHDKKDRMYIPVR